VRKAIDGIDVRAIVPPELIADFIVLGEAAHRTPKESDLQAIKLASEFSIFGPVGTSDRLSRATEAAMSQINNCLRETGWATINGNGFAIPVEGGWFGDRLSFWHLLKPGFCPEALREARASVPPPATRKE
jgi:hypothetical protein